MAETLIACVFRAGGDYTLDHVDLLKKQVPGLVCFGVDIPFLYDWPGWWGKMELFRPDIEKDILFFDLDTVITGDIKHYKSLTESHFLADFYKPDESIGSGMMFIRHVDKARVWNDWISAPEHHRSNYH